MSNLSLVPHTDHRIREYISEFLLDKKITRRSQRTLDWYQEKLESFVAWLIPRGVEVPSEITTQQIRGYLGEIHKRGLSDATLHGYARAIKVFLRWCEHEGYSDSVLVPMPLVEAKRPRIPSSEDLKALLAVCRWERDQAMLLTLADTGLRASECLALDWGDINLDDGTIHLRRTKTRRWRVVILGAKVRRSLIKYRRLVPHESVDPVWVSQQGKQLTRHGLSMLFRRLCARAGVKVSPHDLRRWFAVNSLRAGMGLEQLRRLLGHSSLTMMKHYVDLLEDDLKDAHSEAGPVDKYI